jgi:hypothetical protein
MAHKRKLIIEREAADAPGEPAESRDLSWKDWLLRKYIRSWYWVGAVFLDIIIFFQAQWSFHLDLLVAALLAVVALVAELVIYLRIWGAKGPLGLPDEDE